MATIYIGDTGTTPTIRRRVYQSVWVKRRWADAWQWVPYMWCANCEEAAGPSMGQAEIHYEFGRILRERTNTFQIYLPNTLNGWYVAVLVHDYYGSAVLWVGKIVVEDDEIHGGSLPQGMQVLTAYELGHVLDRMLIRGAYTDDGFISRPVSFNRQDVLGIQVLGNRSTAVSGTTGTYVFSDDRESWTNLDIARYLLALYTPPSMTWYIVGTLAPLNDIVENHDFDGMTIWQALNVLIDRRRGMGFRVLTDGTGAIYVYVYSLLAYPLAYGDSYLPANEFRVILNFDNSVDAIPNITLNEAHRFNEIVVRGAPLRTCFTVSFYDGTLEPGWTQAEQVSYELTDDTNRGTDKYQRVYQYFRIPKDWPWIASNGFRSAAYNIAAPLVWRNGFIVANQKAVTWNVDKTLRREIPFEVESALPNAPKEYRRPLVAVNNPGTNDWLYVDKLDDAELTPCSVRMADNEMAFYVEPSVNHILGLNWFAGSSDVDPEVDYTTMVATVFVDTDSQMEVFVTIPGSYRAGDGNERKLIRAEHLEAWYVVPNTIQEFVNGSPSYHAGGMVRNDIAELQKIALFAAAWYAQSRATLRYTYQGISVAVPVGALVLGVASNWHLTQVGSAVTTRRWDFQANAGGGQTTYATGFQELDFSGIVGSGD